MTHADLHADAVRDLTAYAPGDDHQRRERARFLALLSSRPDALDRTCSPDHLTASAIVLDEVAEQVLLVLHGKVRRWLQPGGHCEPEDRTLAGAALREATEETGVDGLRVLPGVLDVDRHPAPCAPGVVEHHLDVRYLVVAPAGAEPVVSAESLDVRWFPVGALPDLEASTHRMVLAARARLAAQG